MLRKFTDTGIPNVDPHRNLLVDDGQVKYSTKLSIDGFFSIGLVLDSSLIFASGNAGHNSLVDGLPKTELLISETSRALMRHRLSLVSIFICRSLAAGRSGVVHSSHKGVTRVLEDFSEP